MMVFFDNCNFGRLSWTIQHLPVMSSSSYWSVKSENRKQSSGAVAVAVAIQRAAEWRLVPERTGLTATLNIWPLFYCELDIMTQLNVFS